MRVQPLTRGELHLGEHVCQPVIALGSNSGDCFLAGETRGQVPAEHSTEHQVRRVAEQLWTQHCEDNGSDAQQHGHDQCEAVLAHIAYQAAKRPAEVHWLLGWHAHATHRAGPAARAGAAHDGGVARLRLIRRSLRSFALVGAHRASSNVICEVTISR